MLWVKKIEPASDTVRQASPTDAAAWVTASRPKGFSSYVRGSRVTIAARTLPVDLSGHSLFTPRQAGGHLVASGSSIGLRTVGPVTPSLRRGRPEPSLPARGSGPDPPLPGWIASRIVPAGGSVPCSPWTTPDGC